MLRLLTTFLARLTRRGPAGPPPRRGWNGRPWTQAAPGAPSPGQPDPAAEYRTLTCLLPLDGPEPTHSAS